MRILAEQARLDLDAREAVAVGGEARHLLVRQARADRQALGVAHFRIELAEAAAILGLHLDHLAQFLDRALHVAHLGGKDLQRVGRIVARQHHAVAVQDQAAVGRDRHDRDAVVLRLGGVGVVLHHLQLDEAREQQREGRSAPRHRRRRCAAGRNTVRFSWFLSSARRMSSDRPVLVDFDRAPLRHQQQRGDHRPERGADERPDRERPARETRRRRPGAPAPRRPARTAAAPRRAAPGPRAGTTGSGATA